MESLQAKKSCVGEGARHPLIKKYVENDKDSIEFCVFPTATCIHVV